MSAEMFRVERGRLYRPSQDSVAFLIGGPDKFVGFDKGDKRLSWGKAIPESEWSEVRSLCLRPGPRQAKTFELPDYVSELVNLEYLSVPFPFVTCLDAQRLPRTLRSLQVDYEAERFGSVEASSVRWPAISVPSVQSLFFSGLGPAYWRHLGVGREHLPRLEAFKANLGGDEAVLSALERLGPIEMGEFFDAGDLDLFGNLPDTIQYLYLNSTGRKFDGSKIARLRALKSLMLVAIHSPFDLAWLESLPHLIELELNGVKKLQHVESVLALKKLRRLVVVNCGKPFNKELQAMLANVGYEQLDVRFA